MKSSNLAWRIEPTEEPIEAPQTVPTREEPRRDEPSRMQSRARFDRRTIEIRDQGLAPFRVR